MDTIMNLPDEIIFNILSYLPLRSLYKFKCVCKLWNTLFMDPSFLYLYKIHHFIYDKDYTYLIDLDFKSEDTMDFTTICRSTHQLAIERNIRQTPHTYRIKSIQLRDVFPIPSPQNPSLCITLEFVPPSPDDHGAVKLISVHEDEENKVCYEVLTLNIGQLNTTCRWRPINIPSLSSKRRKSNNIQLLFRTGFAYCIWFIGDLDIEIDVLDMINETYIGHTTFPRESFFSSNLHLLDWNGHLSFAQLVNNELHVLVLRHPTKLKWAEKKRVIKLPFLKEGQNKKVTFYACVNKSSLLFLWHDDKHYFNKILSKYEIYTGELQTSNLDYNFDRSMTDAEFVALKIPYFKTLV